MASLCQNRLSDQNVLLVREFVMGREIGQVNKWIAHSRILPIENVEEGIIADREIGVEWVVVTHARWPLSVKGAWINLLKGRCSVTEKVHCVTHPS